MTDLDAARARALGAPTRQAIVAYLERASRPVAVAELTDHLGLNHNAVRKHLAKLVGAGITREHTEPRTGRGRPRLLYTLDAGAIGDGTRYQRLAVLLAETLATGTDPVDVGRRAAAGSMATARDEPLASLLDQLGLDGFSPYVDRDDGDQATIVLRRCPFADAATANPAAVCRLHLGLAQGLADSIGNLQVDNLLAADPHRAGCRLNVRTPPPRRPPSP